MMADPDSKLNPFVSPAESSGGSQLARAAANPWVVFGLPLAVFMVVGMLEPTAERPVKLPGFSLEVSAYPIVYTVKILLTMGAMAFVWRGYRQFPWRVSPLAVAVGVIGGVVWIALCRLALETHLIESLRLVWLATAARTAFNPLEHFASQPLLAYGFLAIRFWGLVAIVPVIEEFFLRCLVMRYFVAPDWWKVPFGMLTPTAVLVGTLVPILMHPISELFAVVAWFSLVTWLMYRTKSIWDCVIAHVITNLMVGLWVVYSGDWFLW